MRKIAPPQPQQTFSAAPVAAVAFAIVLIAISLVLIPQAYAADTVTRTLQSKTVHVKNPHMPSGTSAKTAVVMDAQTGRLLWAVGPTKRRLIASTTKIMTALVAISRTTPDELLTATAYRAGAGESLAGLVPGEKMTAQDLLRALLLESANDAADTFAARTAPSRAAFVAAMNRKARALGLRGTLYGNPVGLDVPTTYSTARDLAALTRYALTIPRFSNTVGKSRAVLRSGSKVRVIQNRNELVGEYPYVDGVKTGHTTAAGYLLVGAAHKEDANVISVVTGEPSLAARNEDSLKMLRFGRAFYKPQQPLSKNRAAYELPVELQDIKASVYPARNVRFAARNGENVTVTLSSPKELKGPVAAGTRVGSVTVRRGGKVVDSVPVAVKTAVPEAPIAAVMLNALGNILPYLAILALLALAGVLLLRRRKPEPRRPGYVG